MDIFDNICRELSILIRNKVIVPQIVNKNEMYFRYDISELETLLDKNKNIEKDSFLKAIQREIPRYVLAIFNDALEYLMRFTIDDDENDEKRKEQENEIRSKINIVHKYLINESLKDSFNIKNSSKNCLLRDFGWEVNQRLYENKLGSKEGLKYVTIKMDTADTDESIPFGLFYPFNHGDGRKNLVLTLTIEDVDYLLLEFSKIKKVLSDE